MRFDTKYFGQIDCPEEDKLFFPVLTEGELKAMGVERSEDLCFYTLCVVRSPAGDSTVNLRCPVAINDQTRRAMQVILEEGGYHMHHLLSDFGRKEEDKC